MCGEICCCSASINRQYVDSFVWIIHSNLVIPFVHNTVDLWQMQFISRVLKGLVCNIRRDLCPWNGKIYEVVLSQRKLPEICNVSIYISWHHKDNNHLVGGRCDRMWPSVGWGGGSGSRGGREGASFRQWHRISVWEQQLFELCIHTLTQLHTGPLSMFTLCYLSLPLAVQTAFCHLITSLKRHNGDSVVVIPISLRQW